MSVDDIIHCKNEVSDIRNLTDEQNLLAAILYETHLSLTLGKATNSFKLFHYSLEK